MVEQVELTYSRHQNVCKTSDPDANTRAGAGEQSIIT